MTHAYYAIVTFGRPTYGHRRSFYRSLSSAKYDLLTLGGGSMTNARIVGCATRQQALDADISDGSLPIIGRL